MNQPFRLKSILKLRRRERDYAGKEVADAMAAIAVLDNKLAEIDSQQRSMESIRRQSGEGRVSLYQILDAERYQLILAAQSAHIMQDRSLLVQELERRQAKLVLRQQAVKALEKLEQNHRDHLVDMQNKREQARLDEWSQVQTSIAMRSPS
jgi:flagellar export protein FliJ